MITIVFPLVTMLVGILLGVIIRDSFIEDRRADQLERRIKKLERRLGI